MCEFLIKAVDARMPTVQEWRASLQSRLSELTKFVGDHADVPEVEENKKRLDSYNDAKSGLAKSLAWEAKHGSPAISAGKKLHLAAIVNDYESAPLDQHSLDKIKSYCAEPWEQGPNSAPTIAQRWHWARHQVEFEWKRSDKDKAAELEDKDKRGCFKAGDPVVAMPDGHEWGYEEGPPKFMVLKVSGMSVEEGRKYTDLEIVRHPNGEKELVRKRSFSLSISGLSHGSKMRREEFEARVVRKTA